MEDIFFGVTDDAQYQSDLCFSSQIESVQSLWKDPWQELNNLEENQVMSDKSPSHDSDSGLSSVFSIESPQPTNNIFCDDIFHNNENNNNMTSTEEWLENEMEFFSALLSSDEESNDKEEQQSEIMPLVTEQNMNLEKANINTCTSINVVEETNVNEALEIVENQPSMTLRPRLSDRRPTLTTPMERKNVSSPSSTIVKVLKVVTPVGSGKHVSPDVVMKAIDDKNKKNAEHAKLNREKKKTYIKGLENEVDILKSSNISLKKESLSLKNERDALLDEVAYLKSVLANESALSHLLKNIPTVKNIQLSQSFSSRKRSAGTDHDYGVSHSSTKFRKSSGVCLHVDQDTVSLEFCSKCAKMAQCNEQD